MDKISYELYSFDIFDTLITRRVATPAGIFALMNDIIKNDDNYKDLPLHIKENFFRYRKNSEYYLRRRKLTSEIYADITLEDIYDHIKANFGLTNEQRTSLLNLEIQTEIDNIIPIQQNINYLKNLYYENKKTILISDMYLPLSVIRQILSSIDPIFNQIKIYLSSDIHFMKASGEIYKYIKEQENIEYQNWFHIGDNNKSDYNESNKLGINACLYPYIELENYEKTLLSKYSDNGFVQLSIGCAKNIRLLYTNEKIQLGSSLTGPLYYPFVDWLLKQAIDKRIGCLYFVARDGLILKEIADILIKEKNLQIKTEYLFGSKKAWRVAGLDDNTKVRKQFIETLMWRYKDIEKVCGISHEEFCNFIPKNLHKYQKGLNKTEHKNLKQHLLNNNNFIEFVIEKNKKARDNASGYLKQELNKHPNLKIAFVDVDGSGHTQNCMSSMIKKQGCDFEAFYYTSTPAAFEPIYMSFNYFYSLKKPMLGHILEITARAPHGQTLGYTKNELGKFIPVLQEINQNIVQNWGYEEYIQGIREYTRQMAIIEKFYPHICFESQVQLEHYIDFLTKNIDQKTANLLGTITHSLSLEENFEFAPKIYLKDAVKYLLSGKFKTESMLYSKARSDKLPKRIVEYKQNHPKIHKEIFDLFIHNRKKQAYLKILGLKFDFAKLIWINQK